jgi:hypothetical protein
VCPTVHQKKAKKRINYLIRFRNRSKKWKGDVLFLNVIEVNDNQTRKILKCTQNRFAGTQGSIKLSN